MPADKPSIEDRLAQFAPFGLLQRDVLAGLASVVRQIKLSSGQVLVEEGAPLEGIYLLEKGVVDILSSDGDLLSRRNAGDTIGERGLLREGKALLTSRASERSELLLLPAERFQDLINGEPAVAKWFARSDPKIAAQEPDGAGAVGLTALRVSDLMTDAPITCAPDLSVREVAHIMRDKTISSVLVVDGARLAGIVTVHDLTNKVLAEGLAGDTPVARVMTPDPMTIAPDALGLDALAMLSTHGIYHLPVVDQGRIAGLIARTDLIRQQATTASHMVADILDAGDPAEMADVVARVPELLVQLVNAGTRHTAITRRVTDITDAVTRRLLALAEARLGPPPVPYLWLACGSQGRQEQTGISDQDNCLILDDAVTEADDAYFAALAKFASDGLNACGFVYCPGDMMATNPRWRQPRHVWRHYFAQWIAEPDTEAQMLASVMFDLRPIGGKTALFDDLQREVLDLARKNSIFVAHMVMNSLKHTPPLGLFRGVAVIRSGEHKNTVDLKHSGVVPVVDLGRVYALEGAAEVVNTRERLLVAREAGIISVSGGRDLVDAYDLIAETRLRHQAAQIRAGEKPDNFLPPQNLSELERNHLSDAFMVIKTMQSALSRAH